MQKISLRAGQLNADIQCSEEIEFEKVVATASQELQRIIDSIPENSNPGMGQTHSGLVLLAEGDVGVQFQTPTDEVDFDEFIAAVHNEASYFADEAVFVDPPDVIEQHINSDGERW